MIDPSFLPRQRLTKRPWMFFFLLAPASENQARPGVIKKTVAGELESVHPEPRLRVLAPHQLGFDSGHLFNSVNGYMRS